MGYTNSCNVKMYNFANEKYLCLLEDIAAFFSKREIVSKVLYDDTIIRWQDDIMKYVASVYVLEDNNE